MSHKRQQMEEAATSAIRKGGLSSISFRTLADEVGVKSSSVHYHFATKADLAESVVRGYTDDFKVVLAQIEREEPTLRGRLERLIEMFEGLTREGNFCLCGAIAADASAIDGATRRALRSFFEVTETWMADVIEQAPDEVTTTLGSEDIARILVAGLEGAGLIDRAVDGGEHLEAFRCLLHSFTTAQ